MQKAECPPGASIRRREPAKTKDAAIGCVLCRRSLVPSKCRQTITRPCFRRSARIACPRDGTGLTSPARPTARRVLAPGAALPPWRCVGRSSPPKIEARLFAFVTSVVRSRWRRVQQRAENHRWPLKHCHLMAQSIHRIEPREAAFRFRMADKVKYFDNAFPDNFQAGSLCDRHRADVLRSAAMAPLNQILKLINPADHAPTILHGSTGRPHRTVHAEDLPTRGVEVVRAELPEQESPASGMHRPGSLPYLFPGRPQTRPSRYELLCFGPRPFLRWCGSQKDGGAIF